jgi:hypothetical protein
VLENLRKAVTLDAGGMGRAKARTCSMADKHLVIVAQPIGSSDTMSQGDGIRSERCPRGRLDEHWEDPLVASFGGIRIVPSSRTTLSSPTAPLAAPLCTCLIYSRAP